MYQGRCLCKGVKIELQGAIEHIIHCHCSLCRKSSGSAYATNGFIQQSDFSIVKGHDLVSFYEVKLGRKRYFCRRCASPLYSENSADPVRYRLRLGLLDSDIVERPLSHNFIDSKACWGTIETSLACYSEHEPGR
ncbi:GFA family protein [Shewanella surugensis]|uniref:GFA family protein n=1 Tax=Shewanella surugensis TaxID=212020 RepID=A0ABT0L9E4_9GAMM|nr:GFA family protein [Shewanella surugensis]MCL1123771.1 GFA family protein [Shewanella surugensis]